MIHDPQIEEHYYVHCACGWNVTADMWLDALAAAEAHEKDHA